eukprot:9894576-Lingulodinium_polyedra.AAC.1
MSVCSPTPSATTLPSLPAVMVLSTHPSARQAPATACRVVSSWPAVFACDLSYRPPALAAAP